MGKKKSKKKVYSELVCCSFEITKVGITCGQFATAKQGESERRRGREREGKKTHLNNEFLNAYILGM